MCAKVFALCFVFVCFPPVCLCVGEDIGEICLIESLNVGGVCKNISGCAYARKIVSVDEKKPPLCKWMDRTMIVCCPSKDIIYSTGVFGRMYQGADEGVRRSRGVTCYYNGQQPLICCPNKVDVKLPPETGCPPLKIPEVTPSAANIAWKKCAEYQRYVHRCVASDDNPDRLIRANTCGIPDSEFKISAGRLAEKNEFPHMALLGCANPTETGLGVHWVGGGTLISDKYVLTAGHVLIDPDERPVRYVLLGTLNKTDTMNSLLFNIVRKIPHPNYVSSEKYYDIALVELHKRVMLSEFVRPACLPVPEITVEKTQKRIIAGWGRVTESGDSSTVLLTADVTVATGSERCNKVITNKFAYDPSSMICAFGRAVGGSAFTDTCRGDSGGPLMVLATNLDCTYSVDGVVSFGPNCGKGAGAIYTRVSHYLDWIVKNVWPDEATELIS